MGIRSFIRSIREEILPETLSSQLEELEELEDKLTTLKLTKKTVVFKKTAEVDFYKAVIKFCEEREKEKENNDE